MHVFHFGIYFLTNNSIFTKNKTKVSKLNSYLILNMSLLTVVEPFAIYLKCKECNLACFLAIRVLLYALFGSLLLFVQKKIFNPILELIYPFTNNLSFSSSNSNNIRIFKREKPRWNWEDEWRSILT